MQWQRSSLFWNCRSVCKVLFLQVRKDSDGNGLGDSQYKTLCDLNARLAYAERETIELHKEIISLVATYSQCVVSFPLVHV